MDRNRKYYEALLNRDRKYDGAIYFGITSTGIYCRSICTARKPKFENCRYFINASAAEKAGFRACKRCRPELAPGNAPTDDAERIAALIKERINNGVIEADAKVREIADQFELSTRQIGRITQKELGSSPLELLKAKRLGTAKKLLGKDMPITQIAYESGFKSLRRFNDAFVKEFKISPTEYRKKNQEKYGKAFLHYL